MHPSGRPATNDEQAVNDKIFGECNHRDWSELVDGFNQRILACTGCGGEFTYEGAHGDERLPALNQSYFLLTAIRKYSEEEVLASLILRQVEAAGWRPLLKQELNEHSCSLERGSHRFTSGPQASRPSAVCAAAAQLGASGHFKAATGT